VFDRGMGFLLRAASSSRPSGKSCRSSPADGEIETEVGLLIDDEAPKMSMWPLMFGHF